MTMMNIIMPIGSTASTALIMVPTTGLTILSYGIPGGAVVIMHVAGAGARHGA